MIRHHLDRRDFLKAGSAFAAFNILQAAARAVSPNGKLRTAHIGVGAFNLIKTAVYREVGGHERIRMRPDDDLKLGKIVKLAHHRQDLVDATGMISLEMYRSVGELVHGLEKNAFSGADYSVPLTVFSSLLSLLFGVWPFGVAMSLTSQLVGQRWPLPMLKGRPDVCR